MLDKKDMLIMSYLRMNSRETLTRISKKTQLPVSTIYERLKGAKAKLILKHTALIDFAQLGFMTRAHVLIKASKSEKYQLQDYLSKHQHVNSLTKINNGYDFMVEVVFRHVQDLEGFLEALEQRYKLKKQVHYVLSDVRKESFLSDPALIGLVKAT